MNKLRGLVLYKGPSLLDGKPIVCIATFNSKNEKTGNMIQTWILVDNKKLPTKNLQEKLDGSICGDCVHRTGSCYVNLGIGGPNQVYKGYQNGIYPKLNLKNFEHIQAFRDRVIRIGSYGDGTAIPYKIWEDILPFIKNWTGYTHQWRQKCFNAFRFICMASVESEEQANEAHKLGWRTFRVKTSSQDISSNEFVCPASIEAGHKTTCEKCKACRGYVPNKPGIYNVVIDVHGFGWKKERYKNILEKMNDDKKLNNDRLMLLPLKLVA